MRTLISFIPFLATLSLGSAARAASQNPEKTPAERRPQLDVGVLGGVAFPRPLALEAVVGIDKTVMFGAEYSFLPETTFSAVKVGLWAVALDARVFPFRGPFFVGLRGGFQKLSGRATLTAANLGSIVESADVGTWFVNPRVGFLWIWKPVALGLDVGVQIPVSTTVARSSLLAKASPALDSQVTEATELLGRTVLPTVDLLRLGLVF